MTIYLRGATKYRLFYMHSDADCKVISFVDLDNADDLDQRRSTPNMILHWVEVL